MWSQNKLEEHHSLVLGLGLSNMEKGEIGKVNANLRKQDF